MATQTHVRLASAIFAIVVVIHRALKGLEATLEGVTIPVEAIWV